MHVYEALRLANGADIGDRGLQAIPRLCQSALGHADARDRRRSNAAFSASLRGRVRQLRPGVVHGRLERRIGLTPEVDEAPVVGRCLLTLAARFVNLGLTQVTRREVEELRGRALKRRLVPAQCFVIASKRHQRLGSRIPSMLLPEVTRRGEHL